jgi:hypothetical protein
MVAWDARKGMRLRSVSDDVPVTDEVVQPQQLLSLFQYGDLIHWGKQAAALRALAVDDFSYTKGMHDYISVVSQPSHF